jgi:anhydro-N-acetylmuramic acid kinase
VRLDLIGCHGQTLYHQGAARPFLGGAVACTWQTGEPAVLAARLGVPVVSDFRPADMAANGQGAPLVPLLDFVAFRHATRNRVLQNLGGIGNLTVIPAGARPRDVFAFDTGPANMVIDALMAACFRKPYDRGGAIAARGRVIEDVLKKSLSHPFFRQPPPRSAGREQFGREFAARFLAACRQHSSHDRDAVATATALTARSIGLAWKDFVLPKLRRAPSNDPTDCIVAGGGAFNPALMAMLRAELSAFGKVRVESSGSHGMPVAAKEAMAFALLAWRTWHHLPGNLPIATGAERPAILGKISHA